MSAILLGMGWATQAEDYMVRTWGVDDGLPEDTVTDVAQSADGYLWLSTQDNSLCRFDGVRFVKFPLPTGQNLSGRGARRLFVEPNGKLWFNGFAQHLGSRQGGKFHTEYPGPVVVNALVSSEPERVVFAAKGGQLLEGKLGVSTNASWRLLNPPGGSASGLFFADREGGVWYQRADGRLGRLRGETAETVAIGDGGRPASPLAGNEQGDIIAVCGGKLWLWTGSEFVDRTPSDGGAALSVSRIRSDGLGGWWVAANERLRHWQEGRWVAEATGWTEFQRDWSGDTQALADGQGGLWLGFRNRGLLHVSPNGRLSRLTTKEGLPSNAVRFFTRDRENNLWVCFDRGGLARVRQRAFGASGRKEGLADVAATSVCADAAGRVWVGTASGRVSCWASGQWSNYTLPLATSAFASRAVVCVDAAGQVWVGTQGNGVLVGEAGRFRHVISPTNGVISVSALLAARAGGVWVAGQYGLYCIAGQSAEDLLPPDLQDEYPTALAEGKDGAIWVGMNVGKLLLQTKGALATFRPGRPEQHCRFSAMVTEDDGSVWIATTGAGLLRFQEGHFQAVGLGEGLPTETIFQLVDDGAGQLWLGTATGIYAVPKTGLEDCIQNPGHKLKFRSFGRDDGLPTLGCAVDCQPGAWRDRDGRLWFATSDGITWVRPADLPASPPPPITVLEELRVDGKLQTLPEQGRNQAVPGRLELAPGRHHLEFRYTGLSFTAPERVRFSYQMEGLDPDWVDGSGNRTATYNSVPPGRYRFLVKACNSSGEWSAAAASLPLLLQPHFWETGWFYSGVIGVSLLSVGSSITWVLRRRHQRELLALAQRHALERERARIAQDLHDDLGAGLAQIGFASAMAQNPAMPPEAGHQLLGEIGNRSRDLVRALDEIVWAINPKNDSVRSLSSYFCQFVQGFLKNTTMSCRLELADDLPATPLNTEQRHNLFLAFEEAVHNAVRHSGGSVLSLSIWVEHDILRVVVADNGHGIQGEAPPDADGLTGMRRRLETLGGWCDIAPGAGGGTQVRFRLPLTGAN